MYIESTTEVAIDRWKHETTTKMRAFTVNDVVMATVLEYNTVVEALEAFLEFGCVQMTEHGDRVPRVYRCNPWIDMWVGTRSTHHTVLTTADALISWVESNHSIKRAV